MEDWVHRAMARWPNVPALFGWLALDRRGRWSIRGEVITRQQIIDTINRNYAPDEQGRWYFQNGPQRGYMQLGHTPLVLWTREGGDYLQTHTGLRVRQPSAAWLDEEGSLLLQTEHGPALLSDTELDWALARLQVQGAPMDEAQLAAALALPAGRDTGLVLQWGAARLELQRIDSSQVERQLGFVRDPQPRPGERHASGDVPE